MTALIYIRVSTTNQTISPEAQETELRAYCERQGWAVASVVKEVASGMDDDRELLADAVARCAREGHKLVIKRIDRLSRKLSKTAELIENPNVEIVCSETGPVNAMVLAMLAVVAAEERRLISVRTKSALAQRKADGQRLGFALHGPEIQREAAKKGNATREERSRKHMLAVGAIIHSMRVSGNLGQAPTGTLRKRRQVSYEAIGRELTNLGIPTSYQKRSTRWMPSRVHSIYRKYLASGT